MSLVKNADDFLNNYRKIRDEYETGYREKINELRQSYSNNTAEILPSDMDEALEAHCRTYCINGLLRALNWRLDLSPEDGLPNLYPEVPVRSLLDGNMKFLDYLGEERETLKPLLIVETKRPSSRLPAIPAHNKTPSEIICDGINGKEITGEWAKWLNSTRDYFLSTSQVNPPKRLVITNGEWLVLFLDPLDAFSSESSPAPAKIVVFIEGEIESRCGEIFEHLAYQKVSSFPPPVTPEEIRSYICPNEVESIIHGLHLIYQKERHFSGYCSPLIKVRPIICVKSRTGKWLQVEGRGEYELPDTYSELFNHIDSIDRDAFQLLATVNSNLGLELNPVSLSDHYEDSEQDNALVDVMELAYHRNDNALEYLIITGEEHHYLRRSPSVVDCPFHSLSSPLFNQATRGIPIFERRADSQARSFFLSGEKHHCAHQSVFDLKSAPITNQNITRSGYQRVQANRASCKIWPFEQFLCCKVCVFERVCAQFFAFPC